MAPKTQARPKRKAAPSSKTGTKQPTKKAKVQKRAQKVTTAALNQAPTDSLAVYVFGDGEAGQLGLGPNVLQSNSPRPNPFIDPRGSSTFKVVDIACGGMHVVALTADNKILTWGVNDNAALGRPTAWDGGLRDVDADPDEDGDLNPLESTPTEVSSKYFQPSVRFAQVAAGDSCTFVLTTTGDVYGWGTFRNSKGDDRFGYDKNGKAVEKQLQPTLVRGVQDIIKLACGTNHVLALDKNGKIWSWGCNDENQLGRRLFGRHSDGLIPGQVNVCQGNAAHIASGESHSFAVGKRGDVWAWGRNTNCECAVDIGDDASAFPRKIPSLANSHVIQLDGGANHSIAVTSEGRCFAWGRMDIGQLGFEFTPEQLQDERLLRRGIRGRPQVCTKPTVVPDLGHVLSVACGVDHTLFVNHDGKSFSTGFGFSGQLGHGSEDDDIDVAKEIGGRVRDKRLSQARAGGHFSVLIEVAK